MMCEFIAEHRARFGVVPICRALSEHGWKIAPRTFYAWQKRPPSKRALWDTVITEILAGYYQPDENRRRRPASLYGSLKMWAHLNREGIQVARCTVERLMRRNGWQGVTRAKKVRTTIQGLPSKPADPTAKQPTAATHQKPHHVRSPPAPQTTDAERNGPEGAAGPRRSSPPSTAPTHEPGPARGPPSASPPLTPTIPNQRELGFAELPHHNLLDRETRLLPKRCCVDLLRPQ